MIRVPSARVPWMANLLVLGVVVALINVDPAISLDARKQEKAAADIERRASEAAALVSVNPTIAISVFRTLLNELERKLGPNHPDTMALMNNLAAAYRANKDLDAAGGILRRVVDTLQNVFGPEDERTLTAKSNLARVLQDQKRFTDAEPLLVDVLSGRRKLFGNDNKFTEQTERKLAEVYLGMGRLKEAAPLALDLALRNRKLLGVDDPESIKESFTVSKILSSLGRQGEATIVLEDTVKALRETKGEKDADTLFAMNELGIRYAEQGRYSQAEALFQVVYSSFRDILGNDNDETISVLTNFASIYFAEGKRDSAAEMLASVLASRRKVFGERSFEVASAELNLAWTFFKDHKFDQSLDLLTSATKSLRELSPGHKEVYLTAINNLALTYQAKHEFDLSNQLLSEVVEGRRAMFGDAHPLTLDAIDNLVLSYEGAGKFDEAVALLKPALSVRRQRMAHELENAPLADAKSAASAAIGITWDIALSLALMKETDETRALAANSLLGFKGFRGEYDAQLRRASQHLSPDKRDLVDRLRAVNSELSRINSVTPPNSAILTEFRSKQEELRNLEMEVAGLVPEFASDVKEIDWREVVAGLGAGEVLIEYRVLSLRDSSNLGLDEKPKVVGVLLQRDKQPVIQDLGFVSVIAADLKVLSEMRIGDENYEPARIRVYKAIVAPFGGEVETATGVYISPDSILNNLPFDLLRPGREKLYWTQAQPIHIIPTGRSLIASASRLANGEAFLFGAPEYGLAPRTEENNKDSAATETLDVLIRACHGGRPLPLLPKSADEARAVAALFEQNGIAAHTPLLGTEATKAALEQIRVPPQFLHLATHGCVAPVGFAANSLRRVQLAFAGANLGDNNVLTGAEAALLQLDGTLLVTLSACDTSAGDIENGEGAMSLAYAFRLAGARNVLTTLSKVGDEAAKEFLVAFYGNLLSTKPFNPNDALRNTKLQWISRGRADSEWASVRTR